MTLIKNIYFYKSTIKLHNNTITPHPIFVAKTKEAVRKCNIVSVKKCNIVSSMKLVKKKATV